MIELWAVFMIALSRSAVNSSPLENLLSCRSQSKIYPQKMNHREEFKREWRNRICSIARI